VESRRGECRIYSGAEERGVGGNVVGGANENAVDGVDGDVVREVKGRGNERGNAFGEVLEQLVLFAAGVEQDREADGIISGDLHPGGMKDGAGIEADLELVQRDRRYGLSVRREDQRGDLDEVRVDVECIEIGVGRRSIVLSGHLRGYEQGQREKACGQRGCCAAEKLCTRA